MSSPGVPLSMAPLVVPAERHPELDDLALDFAAKCSGLARQLHPVLRNRLADLLSLVNGYHSVSMEGRPVETRAIARAVTGEYDDNPDLRARQAEAAAFIGVQSIIDRGADPKADPTSRTYLCWIHSEFTVRASASDTGTAGQPGIIRGTPTTAPSHTPPPPEQLPSLLDQYEGAFANPGLSRLRRLVTVAAAHHRLLWIVPFPNFNGHIARLASYALLRRLDIGTNLWSLPRGLARHIDKYNVALAQAADPTEGVLDFTRFFFTTAIEQVDFMETLLDPLALDRRIRIHVEEEQAAGRLPAASAAMLREVLLKGTVPRESAKAMTGYRDRAAREVLYRLMETGFIETERSRGPLRLGIPLDAVERWFPLLLPMLG